MEMTTVKTFAVFAIIFGCFAILYPRIFHPMLLHVMGMTGAQQSTDDILNRVPPHLRKGPHPSQQRRSSEQAENIARHMRSPHPGMRAAAEMKRGTDGGGGGAKGLMTVVLPIYAVGIVIYLFYTLFKVFGKNKEKVSELDTHFRDVRFDPNKNKYVYGERAGEEDGLDPEYREYQQKKAKERDLETLLLRAEDNSITHTEVRRLKSQLVNMEDTISRLLTSRQADSEMRVLRQRLMDTENQMNRILTAMEKVQERIDTEEQQEEEEAADVPDQLGPSALRRRRQFPEESRDVSQQQEAAPVENITPEQAHGEARDNNRMTHDPAPRSRMSHDSAPQDDDVTAREDDDGYEEDYPEDEEDYLEGDYMENGDDLEGHEDDPDGPEGHLPGRAGTGNDREGHARQRVSDLLPPRDDDVTRRQGEDLLSHSDDYEDDTTSDEDDVTDNRDDDDVTDNRDEDDVTDNRVDDDVIDDEHPDLRRRKTPGEKKT